MRTALVKVQNAVSALNKNGSDQDKRYADLAIRRYNAEASAFMQSLAIRHSEGQYTVVNASS